MNFQRANIRLNVPEDQRKAVVLYGTRQFECALVDESAGGFAVRFGEQFHLPQGTQLKLRSQTGWTVVTVARCRLLPDGMEVGLKRQEDLPDAKELSALRPSWRDYLTTWRSKYDGMLSAVAVVVLGFGAWLGIAYYYTGNPIPPVISRTLQGSFGISLPKFQAPPPSRECVTARSFVTTRLGEILKSVKTSLPSKSDSAEQAREDCLRYARYRALALPETVPALGLSKAQSHRIREAVRIAENDILERIHGREDETERAETTRSWLKKVEAEVLSILTTEQRATWETLTAPFLDENPHQESAVSSNSL